MKALINEVRYCQSCKKNTMHIGNGTKINWVMHIALIFLFGIGLLTMAFAVLDHILHTKSMKMSCQVCGNEVEAEVSAGQKVAAGFIIGLSLLFGFSIFKACAPPLEGSEYKGGEMSTTKKADDEKKRRERAAEIDAENLKKKVVITPVETSPGESVRSTDPEQIWQYESAIDKMTSKETKFGTLVSRNKIDLDFPYMHDNNRGTLQVRKHPQHGLDIMFFVQKGQINCSFNGCSVVVKFDDGNPMRWSVNEPSDNSSEVIFFNNEKKFLELASKAKRILVEVEFFHQGSRVFEFQTIEPLVWK